MASGEFSVRRRAQDVKWMWAMIEDRLMGRLRDDRTLRACLPEIEQKVADGRLAATAAAEDVLALAGFA
jgi:LAO/AO transport system kinase